MSKQKPSRSYKDAFQLRIDTVGSLTCSGNCFRIQFARQRMGASPPTPSTDQAMLFLSIVQLPGVGLRFPGRVLECERWGGL